MKIDNRCIEFHIAAGKIYLSPILDTNNGEIVSYNISLSPNFIQTVNMLNKSLVDRGIIQSMSKKGICLYNCVMENFFGKMKNEVFYGHEYECKTLYELELTMNEYIKYYNEERI